MAKVRDQFEREVLGVACCTVERLMRRLGIAGVFRGKRFRTTIPDDFAFRPQNLVQGSFVATRPNQLWVADLAYVSMPAGFAYAAFVIDADSRRIFGWRVSSSLSTEQAFDALEQAQCVRRPPAGLVHHSHRGVRYLSIKYTKRLTEAGIEPSLDSAGDAYGVALAETIIGLYETEVIEQQRP